MIEYTMKIFETLIIFAIMDVINLDSALSTEIFAEA
jgi:hypothetical protein